MSFKDFARRDWLKPSRRRILTPDERRRRNRWLMERMPDIRVGDLVSYNAAGMLHKTLGVVYEIEDDAISEYRNLSIHEGPKILTIQWCVVGDVMPKTERFIAPRDGPKIVPGQFYRHRIGTWFRVVEP